MKKVQGIQKEENYGVLFNEYYFKTTCVLILNWFVNTFIYYALIFMVPYTLDQRNRIEGIEGGNPSDISQLYWGILVEIPTMFVAWFAADSELGRKNSLILFFFLTSLPLIILLFIGLEYLILLAALAKFSIAVCFILIYAYTLEVYTSNVRVTALGLTGGIGRCGGVVFPFILIAMSDIWTLGPYWILFALAFCTFLLDFSLPRETKGEPLDKLMGNVEGSGAH